MFGTGYLFKIIIISETCKKTQQNKFNRISADMCVSHQVASVLVQIHSDSQRNQYSLDGSPVPHLSFSET